VISQLVQVRSSLGFEVTADERLGAAGAEGHPFAAEEKKVTLRASLPETLRLAADRNRIQQALANLIDNAIKYNVPGGLVEVTASQMDSQAVVQVRDTGLGISSEDLPRIWERLYRGDKSRSQKGLGLGLCLVKAVVQAHHGEVEVESRLGKGSLFTMRLPVSRLS
jgi:signal transduction histidine kinase